MDYEEHPGLRLNGFFGKKYDGYEGEEDEKEIDIEKDNNAIKIDKYVCNSQSLANYPIHLKKDGIFNNNIVIFIVPTHGDKYIIECYLADELNQLLTSSPLIIDSGNSANKIDLPVYKLKQTNVLIEENYFVLTRYCAFILSPEPRERIISGNKKNVYRVRPISKTLFLTTGIADFEPTANPDDDILDEYDFVKGYYPFYDVYVSPTEHYLDELVSNEVSCFTHYFDTNSEYLAIGSGGYYPTLTCLKLSMVYSREDREDGNNYYIGKITYEILENDVRDDGFRIIVEEISPNKLKIIQIHEKGYSDKNSSYTNPNHGILQLKSSSIIESDIIYESYIHIVNP